MIFKHILHKFIIAISIVLIATSCSEDFFSKTIELEGDWDGPEMIVHARLNTLDDTLGIYLQKSQPIYDESETSSENSVHIVDADVSLRGDDGSEYDFYFDSLRVQELNYFAAAQPALKEGVTYTLHIDHPDFEAVEVTEVMPVSPELQSHNWKKNYRFDPIDSTYYTQLELGYANNREEHFMSHLFEYTYTENGNTQYGSIDFDPGEFELGSFKFSREIFESVPSSGNTAELFFEVPTSEIENLLESRPNVQLVIFGIAITEPDYLFHRSVQQHFETGNLPFTEPVIVYSNIDNAHGIFSLINTTEIRISFPE